MKKSFHRIFCALSCAFCLLSLSACTVHFGPSVVGINVDGEGEVLTKSFTDLTASKLSVKNIHVKRGNTVSQVSVKITSGTEKKITLTAQENLFDHLSVKESSGKLTIQGKALENYVTDEILVEISGYTFTELDLACCQGEVAAETIADGASLSLSGASELSTEGLQKSSLNVDSSGASKYAMPNATVENLTVHLSGASEFKAEALTATTLSLHGSGASKYAMPNATVENLTVHLSGASEFKAETLTATTLSLHGSGASHLVFSGATEQLLVDLSGATRYLGENMTSKNAEVSVSGGSKVKVWATETLSVVASGGSLVEYGGTATITKTISGGSVVKPL